MKHLRNGKKLLVVLSLWVSLGTTVSCRTTRPPAISNCIGDGLGGCDGFDRTGQEIHKAPSELENWIMFPQPEFAEFAGWCFNVRVEQAKEVLEKASQNKSSFKEVQAIYFAPYVLPNKPPSDELPSAK